MCAMRKTAVPSAGILGWSCTEPVAIQVGFRAGRPAAHPGLLCCTSQHCPASNKPFPTQGPGGWRSQTAKQTLSHQVRHIHRVIPTRATLMLPHHLWERKGGLHEFSLSNLVCIWCSQGILPTHAWRRHCTGASKPWQALGKMINNCTRKPPFQKESALRHRACSEWRWFWPAACL